MAGVFGGKNSKDTDRSDLIGVNGGDDSGDLLVESIMASGDIQLVVGGRVGALHAAPQ